MTYVHDEGGRRLLKRIDGVPVRAKVAGGILTEDHFVELVVVGGVVAGVIDNGTYTALLTDVRGTPFAGPDGTMGLATPYGVRQTRLRNAEQIDYAKLGWDPDLGTVRMGVRDYDATLGQFWTPDPLYLESLEACAKSPIDCNLYGYAKGNPLSWVDPEGTNPDPSLALRLGDVMEMQKARFEVDGNASFADNYERFRQSMGGPQADFTGEVLAGAILYVAWQRVAGAVDYFSRGIYDDAHDAANGRNPDQAAERFLRFVGNAPFLPSAPRGALGANAPFRTSAGRVDGGGRRPTYVPVGPDGQPRNSHALRAGTPLHHQWIHTRRSGGGRVGKADTCRHESLARTDNP